MNRYVSAGVIAAFLSLAAGTNAEEREHLSLSFGPTRVELTGGAALDVRGASAEHGRGRPTGVDVARRRLGVRARLGAHLELEAEQELADRSAWRDVWVDYRLTRAMRFRAGQFKIPFSLEATTSALQLDFASRSRAATFLAPGRDQGVMAHGRLWGKQLEYETGLFRHDGDRPAPDNETRTFGDATAVGRLSFRPFAHATRTVRDLHVGVAATRARLPEGLSNLHARSIAGDTFFPSSYWASGRRRRTGVEGRWRPGPVTVSGEYLWMSDERNGQGLAGDDLPALVGSGWYASTVWRLPVGTTRPRVRLEATARLEGMQLGSAAPIGDPSTSPRAPYIAPLEYNALTLGLNIWVTRHAKALVNVVRERTTGADGTSAGRGWAPVLRVQVGL